MTITPTFFFDLESKMRLVSSRAYDKLALPEKSWWNKVCKVQTIETKKERLIWLLDTAEIGRPQASHGGGQQRFDEMVSVTQEREVENALVDGLKIKREELEDKDANGLDQAAHWARQAGALFGYWPQLALSKAILANPTAYDGVAFFHASAHVYNPYDSTAGTYGNLLTGAASGAYPGACPIDESVTVDVALKNLAKVVAYVSQIKTPNGLYPRNLRVATLLVPPALFFRATQLTNAKFIAQAAATGGGGADVEALIASLGVGMPVQIQELGAGFGGADDTYYVAVEDILNDELGAFTYVEREPFSIIYHGPQTDAQLAQIDEFRWMTRGRNVIAPGHPFMLYKCTRT